MLENSNVLNQLLIEIKENSSSIQASKVVFHDPVQAVHDGDLAISNFSYFTEHGYRCFTINPRH